MRGTYFAFVLLDECGVAQYVGVGRDGQWENLWRSRHVARDSELTRWLLSLEKPPTIRKLMSITVPRAVAKTYAASERDRLTNSGVQLLDPRAKDRPIESYVGGSTKRRAVVAPDGTTYASVRATARAVGLTAAGIVHRCQKNIDGWHYADRAEKTKP